MKQVIVFPRGQLAAKDKERLTKAGIVAVEADDPSKVVTVLPTASLLTPDDLLMSALAGIAARSYESSSENMFNELHRRAKLRESRNLPRAAAVPDEATTPGKPDEAQPNKPAVRPTDDEERLSR